MIEYATDVIDNDTLTHSTHDRQVKTELLTDWDEILKLAAEWNTLLRISRADSVFLTWEWISTWIEIARNDVEPFFIVARDGGHRLIGVAPFYRVNMQLMKLLRYRTLRIASDHATGFEYADWIVAGDGERRIREQIVRELLARKRHWDLVWMPKMSGWSGSLEQMRSAIRAGTMLHRSRPRSFSRFHLPGTLQDFEQTLSSKRRQQLRRTRRKLLAKEGVEIRHCTCEAEIPEFLDALFHLHHLRRMRFDDPGTFVRKPAEAEFYRHFAPRALVNGWLKLMAISDHGRMVAVQIGYVYNGIFQQLQEGFDPDYNDGVGNVLRHVIVEECIEAGLTTYDFLGEFSEHKRRWGARQVFGHDLLIAHPCTKNRLLFMQEIWPTGRLIQETGLYEGRTA